MSLDPRLLDLLRCPPCGRAVVLLADGTGLKCSECRRVYPILDGIPVMLVEEAKIEVA